MLVAAFFLSALAVGSGNSPAATDLLQRAEKEFAQGLQSRAQFDQARPHFQQAFTCYQELHRRGAANVDLYRNEGNAAILSDNLPEAILAFRRGLRLDPTSRALQASLEDARDLVSYPPESPCRPAAGGWPFWFPEPSDSMLLAVAVILYALACIAITRWWIVRRGPLLLGAALFLLLACGSGTWLAINQCGQMQASEHPLVVVKNAGALRTGNGLSYPTSRGLPSVSRGMEGRLLFARGDWLQVEFPGSELGWIERGMVLVDAPP